jgi:ketosteroid isomerase-like protein
MTIKIDEKNVLDLEERRCTAIGNGDLAALNDILANDYLHVGGAGTVSDKEKYIATIGGSPRAPERANLHVRVYGDAAVLTGDLINRIGKPGEPPRVVDTFATQVAIRTGDKWCFVSFQLTQKKTPTY